MAIWRTSGPFLAACLAALTAGAFEGRVVDRAGHPVAGARITVADRQGTVVADGEGRFRVTPDPDPPFVLVVARPDGVVYAPVTVAALPEGVLTVTVEPLGETITVLSGSPPDLEVPPGAQATVLGRTALERRMPRTVAGAVDGVPGASVSGSGPSAVPALRGLPKGRTLLLLDEGRVTAERRAGPSATFLDPETVDEIEVVRGPGSVAYGSDAFGGVIRARSRMPEPGAPFGLRFALFGGSATREAGASAELSGPVAGGAGLLGVHHRDAGNIESPRGTVPNSGAERSGLRLAWQRELGAGVLRIGWRSDLGRDIGKPRPDPGAKRRWYPEEDSHRLSVAYERPGPGAWDRLAASLFWDSERLVLDKDTLVAGGVASRSRTDTDARDWGVRFEAERAVGRTRLVVGLDGWGRYGLDSVATRFEREGGTLTPVWREMAMEGAHSENLGLYAGLSSRAGVFRLSAGVRADAVRAASGRGYFSGRTVSHGALSGFLAATAPLGTGLDATVQVASGFRDARLSDRFYRGETGRGFITGNPDLDPERSRQIDAVLRWRHGEASVALAGYLYRIDDLIERYKHEGNYFFRNRDEAELMGIELEAALPLGGGIALELGAWSEHGEIRGTGDPVDDIPAPGLSLGVAGSAGERWWWFVRGRATARKTRPGPSERETGGWAVLDVGGGVRLGRGMELRIRLANVLDRWYLPTADEHAVPAPGRSLLLRLGGRF